MLIPGIQVKHELPEQNLIDYPYRIISKPLFIRYLPIFSPKIHLHNIDNENNK